MTKVAVAALAYVVKTVAHSRRPLALHAYHVTISHVTDHYIDVVHGWWWRCIVLLTWWWCMVLLTGLTRKRK